MWERDGRRADRAVALIWRLERLISPRQAETSSWSGCRTKNWEKCSFNVSVRYRSNIGEFVVVECEKEV